MTNLHMANDHPSALLSNTELYSEAALLRTYEDEHDVTFAALDNDTLNAIREVYNRELPVTDEDDFILVVEREEFDRLSEMEALIADLLGLED